MEAIKGRSEWKRITVIGGGVSGRSLALLASRLGADVFVSEKGAEISKETEKDFIINNIKWETCGHSPLAYNADAIILSSGIPPYADCIKEAKKFGIPVIGELDFAAPYIKSPVIAVTGSNGKSTVTALIGHILKKMGLKAEAGGNLGKAASDFADEFFDSVVLELSSFQLARASTLKTIVSIVTNLAPDHIDWHGSYESYVSAKARAIALRGGGGWGIVQDRDFEALLIENAENVAVLSWDTKPLHDTAAHIFMDKDKALLRLEGKEELLFYYSDSTLIGRHNMENTAMSLAAAFFLTKQIPSSSVLEGFSPLPHRCEFAGVVGDVTYIDDSKGTNVDAAVTALKSIEGRKVVILGGRGKGESYSPLASAVLQEADTAVLLGEESDSIEKALKEVGFLNILRASDMQEAVQLASSSAKPGMVVLLSPACTSWDMYSNYAERGKHFCSLVLSMRA